MPGIVPTQFQPELYVAKSKPDLIENQGYLIQIQPECIIPSLSAIWVESGWVGWVPKTFGLGLPFNGYKIKKIYIYHIILCVPTMYLQ